MATILLAIGVPLAVVALGAITKLVWDMKAVISADVVRWEQQAEKWEENNEKWDENKLEHKEAFKDIAELKGGQVEINGKLDILIGREN